MKNKLFKLFQILVIMIFIGKTLNWFLKFDTGTNQILNTAMFCLIGIAYLVMGYVWDKKILKVLITACGIFLIVMNFVPGRTWLSILGIVCILVPMIIARFQKKENENVVIDN